MAAASGTRPWLKMAVQKEGVQRFTSRARETIGLASDRG